MNGPRDDKERLRVRRERCPWNQFQEANRGRSVTTQEWNAHLDELEARARGADAGGADVRLCAAAAVGPATVAAVGPACDVAPARADGDGDARIGATVSADVETQTPWRSWLQWKATWQKKGGGVGSSGTPLPRGNPSCVCCMKLANKVSSMQVRLPRSMWLPSTHAKCTVLTPLCGTPGVRRMKSTGSSAP